MHDYPCKNDVLETKKAVGPVKDECPGGSPGKNRDIFMVLISTATVATFHGRELLSKLTCPKNL